MTAVSIRASYALLPAAALAGVAQGWMFEVSGLEWVTLIVGAMMAALAGWVAAWHLHHGDVPTAMLAGIAAVAVTFYWEAPNVWLLVAAAAQMWFLFGDSRGMLSALVVAAATLGAMVISENVLFWLSGLFALAGNVILTRSRPLLWLPVVIVLAGGVGFDLMHIPLMKELAFFTVPPRWLIGLGILVVVTGVVIVRESSMRRRVAMATLSLAAGTPLFGGYYGMRTAGMLWAVLAVVVVAEFLAPISWARRTAS